MPAHRVLIVDDNADAAHTLCLIVRQLGHQAEAAGDAREALVAARRLRPGFAFIDLGLPGVDGVQLGTQLRGELGAIRLIALTGAASAEARERTAAAGFELHLVKPIDPGFLKSLLGGA